MVVVPANALAQLGVPTVVLDWNGTVVDDLDRAWRASAAAARDHGGRPPRRERFGAEFTLPLAEHLRSLGVSERELAPAERTWNERVAAVAPVAATGAERLFDALQEHGNEVGVVTAAHRSVLDHDLAHLARLGVTPTLSFVRTSVADKSAVLTEVRSSRRLVLYVGDTAHDMDAAVRAGCVAVGVAGGYHGTEQLLRAGAVIVLDDLAELAALVTSVDARWKITPEGNSLRNDHPAVPERSRVVHIASLPWTP